MYNKNKRATVSIEMVLIGALSVVVLFLILGLFSSNLKEMIVNSNMNNFLKSNSKKTANTALANDATQTQINVQTVGSQGLSVAQFNQSAKSTIEMLAKLPELTSAQKINLAQALTLFAESDTNIPAFSLQRTFLQSNPSKSYQQLADESGISLTIEVGYYTTTVNDQEYNWENDFSYCNNSTCPGETNHKRISNLLFIKNTIK